MSTTTYSKKRKMKAILIALLAFIVGYAARGYIAVLMYRRYEAMLDDIQDAIDAGDPDNDSDTVEQIDSILNGRPT